jgi:hypothetical protein
MSKKPNKEKSSYEEESQERLIREIMSKEIIKKIERRIENNDDNVIKTVRQMLDDNIKKY